ncbi:hypothetical protein SCHPADRAFT_243423 [Schizopora paradoxa]|uniref:Uncharacterized protein n=1 Tax=Schizopora paradoxa TaxID=27342 RepID=A0A0H2RVA5_9AGAM|nr:hypothetical protein SCHPADRAFT_243423 [Schizopora paradoxa]
MPVGPRNTTNSQLYESSMPAWRIAVPTVGSIGAISLLGLCLWKWHRRLRRSFARLITPCYDLSMDRVEPLPQPEVDGDADRYARILSIQHLQVLDTVLDPPPSYADHISEFASVESQRSSIL